MVVHWGKERTRMRVAIYYGLGLLLLCFLGGIDVVQYFAFYFIYLLMLITIIALIVGLIRPTMVVRWGKERTRMRVVIYYGLGLLLLSFIDETVKPEALRLQEAQQILEKAKQQLSAANSAYDSGQFTTAQDSARKAVNSFSLKNVKERIPEATTLEDEARKLIGNAQEALELQEAQPILEKAKQQLSAARSAYNSGQFTAAQDSARKAANSFSLKKVKERIPEAATLEDEARKLIGNAYEALELQEAQPILENAKQQLSAARSAYNSGQFIAAQDSARKAVYSLSFYSLQKVKDRIPEAATLEDEAKKLIDRAAAKEKARLDRIAFARKQERLEKARQDSIKWANRPIEEVVKAHAIQRYGKKKVEDVEVFGKGEPKTQAFVEYFSSGHFTRSMHKTTIFNSAFNFFEQIYKDPACNDIDEVIIIVLVELRDYKGRESIGPLVRISFPRVKNVNYENLSYQSDAIIRLIEIEGRIEWYVAGYR